MRFGHNASGISQRWCLGFEAIVIGNALARLSFSVSGNLAQGTDGDR
jgi:hypothetical protein